MGVTKCGVLLLLIPSLFGCKGSNDTVLQPDSAAGSGGSSGAGTGGGGGMPQSGGSGTTGNAAGRGNAAASGGKAPAANGGGGGTAGRSSMTAGSGAGAPSTSAGGTGASEGTSGEGEAGTSGVSGEGASGGGAGSGEVTPAIAQDADCDFNGIWIGQQLTVSEALTLPQTSNNWYYLEFKQSGTEVQVSKHFDCGIEVRGSATVTLSRATLQALLTHNVQIGRKATVTKGGNNCTFDGARFWSVRGGDEMRFLPNATRDATESIDQAAAAKPLPTSTKTDGAVDLENDGKLGVAFQVSGIITGTRNSVQRDWTRWFTEPGFEIAASKTWEDDLEIRADFDNEESILDPTSGLLVSGSMPRAGAKHVMRLRFLGRDASDPRVSAIVKASDAETCFAIQDALPAEALE